MTEERTPSSSGVQELITRLRGEGVDAGRREAARIVEEARTRAGEIVASAQREAADTTSVARAMAEAELRAMREALRLAQRDTVLALREELAVMLRDRLGTGVRGLLGEVDVLHTLLAAMLDVMPRGGVGNAELFVSPPLDDLAREALQPLLAQVLERGVVLRAGDARVAGIRLRLHDDGVELDMSDEALAEMLGSRLTARFHELLTGRDV